MNVYIGIAWGLTVLFLAVALVSLGIAISAFLGWVRTDAIVAVIIAFSFACYSLAPLGYARDRSR